MSYKVKLNIFEGPLDLLLFLIKKDKIDIYDIPIAKITEQYLEYLNLIQMLDLEVAGEFLVVAATLMHIKSKMLLPQDETNPDEEELDPREELVRRLLEYKKYKDAAVFLNEMREKQSGVFLRKGLGGGMEITAQNGAEYFEASLFDLIRAFREVLSKVPKEVFHQVTRNKVTVSDKIHEIYHLLTKEPKVFFLSLFKDARDKDEVIVTFLAILELIKINEIRVIQESVFGDIEIARNSQLVHSS